MKQFSLQINNGKKDKWLQIICYHLQIFKKYCG